LAENREQNDRQRDPEENLFRQIVQVTPTVAMALFKEIGWRRDLKLRHNWLTCVPDVTPSQTGAPTDRSQDCEFVTPLAF
jgi:hypothetical protein